MLTPDEFCRQQTGLTMLEFAEYLFKSRSDFAGFAKEVIGDKEAFRSGMARFAMEEQREFIRQWIERIQVCAPLTGRRF
jgi:hypothetical protein